MRSVRLTSPRRKKVLSGRVTPVPAGGECFLSSFAARRQTDQLQAATAAERSHAVSASAINTGETR